MQSAAPVICGASALPRQPGAPGLLYYGYRYYAPALGRWASRDPINEQGAELLKPAIVLTSPERIESREADLLSVSKLTHDLLVEHGTPPDNFQSEEVIVAQFPFPRFLEATSTHGFLGNNGLNRHDVLGERPGADSFWHAYLNYDTYQAADVWRTIGGWLNATYGPDSNSCATRISYALNGSGNPIPPFTGANRNDDGRRYFISVRTLKAYLLGQWGRPDHELPPRSVAEVKAQLCPGQIAIVVAEDHAGVITTTNYRDPHEGLFRFGGSAWILNPDD